MKKTIRATIGAPVRNAQQPKTPMVGCGSLVAKRNGGMSEVITVRTYFNEKGSGMNPVKACVWISRADGSGESSGLGSASGCGYHKESAAIAEALGSAGVSLFGNLYPRYGDSTRVDYKKQIHFGGTGASAYREIFEAVARAAGYSGRMLWVSHGL